MAQEIVQTSPRTPGRVFILSPAHCGGERARQLCNAAAQFPLAKQLRTAPGAPLGEVFSFLSGLYFRGKLTYARAFAPGPADALVITPGDGLVSAERWVDIEDLNRFASVPIDAGEPRYRLPLARDSARLARRIDPTTEIVLLGSLATGKYLSILAPIFGARLRVPQEFIGRGDMSRGALLLRAARAVRELDYVPVEALQRPARRRASS